MTSFKHRQSIYFVCRKCIVKILEHTVQSYKGKRIAKEIMTWVVSASSENNRSLGKLELQFSASESKC